MASIAKRPDGRWRARYRDAGGKEHAKHFDRKVDAQDWLDGNTAALRTGTWTDPKYAKLTVAQWLDTWLKGYSGRASTVRVAGDHVARIKAGLGQYPVRSLRPSQIRSWLAGLAAEDLAPSYIHILYRRLSQAMTAAVDDGIIARSPCSRKIAPRAGQQRPFVATTGQVWALHDAMPEHLRAAVLLGAFAGLRAGEACGLRVADVDFLHRVLTPEVQYPAEPLKTTASHAPVPVADSMTLALAAQVQQHPSPWILSHDGGQLSPWMLARAIRAARGKVAGLPAAFRYHDCRHYYASLLIASGCDVKVVQARLRHESVKTTLDLYGHLWPDKDESTRAVTEAVFQDHADSVRTARESM